MSNYGRNFGFRITPDGKHRMNGSLPATSAAIPIGAPVVPDFTLDIDALGLQPYKLAGAAAAPVAGQSGIAVYEWAPAAFAGDDPALTTYSDKGDVPPGAAFQVVHGDEVKVVLTNTAENVFLVNRTYTAFTMVAGLGATPTLTEGDLLTPGTGNSTAGYWAETSDAALAWLVITKVDNARGEVEARMLF